MIPYYALEEAALNWGNKTAFISETWGEITFEALMERVSLLAGALKREGLGRGDVLAVLKPNCLEFAELYLAVSALGVVFQPLDVRCRGKYLGNYLTHTQVKALAVHAAHVETVEQTVSDFPLRVIVGGERKGWIEYEGFLNSGIAPASVVEVDEENDNALLLFTSDSDDSGKCVPLTWRQLDFFPHAMIGLLGLGPEDRYVALLPMPHVSGPLTVNLCLISGCSCVISDALSPDEIVDRLEKYRVTAAHTVPSVAELLLQGNPKERDLSAMRFIAVAGISVPADTLTALEEAIPSAKAIQGYGLPETSSLLTLLPLERHADKRGSIGIPLDRAEIRLLDDEGREVPTGEPGEIVVRGGKVFKGYHGNPELTARVIRDGWFHTGDTARVDQDGFYYYLGRKAYLVEVESALLKHPGVKEAVAYGVPDEKRGLIVAAEVVSEKGASLDEAEVRQSMLRHLADYEAPVRIDIVKAVSRTPSGRRARRPGGMTCAP